MARLKLARCFDRRATRGSVLRRRSPLSVRRKLAICHPQGTRNSGFRLLDSPRCLSPGSSLGVLRDLNVYQCLSPVLAVRAVRILLIARFFDAPRPSAAKLEHCRSTINSRPVRRFLTISQLFSAGAFTRPRKPPPVNRNLFLGVTALQILNLYQCYGSRPAQSRIPARGRTFSPSCVYQLRVGYRCCRPSAFINVLSAPARVSNVRTITHSYGPGHDKRDSQLYQCFCSRAQPLRAARTHGRLSFRPAAFSLFLNVMVKETATVAPGRLEDRFWFCCML